MNTRNTATELMTIGRISVDLYSEQLGSALDDVQSFRMSIGGTATNVAVAAARLGHRAALFSRVGNDPMGAYLRRRLDERFGVDIRHVGIDPHLPTPLAFATLEDPAEPELIFYRNPDAPDMQIESTEVDREEVGAVPILWFPMSCLARDPSRSTLHDILTWRDRRPHTIVDLDWRPTFWATPAQATEAIDAILDLVTIAVGNQTECEIAVGESDPARAADALLDRGLAGAVVKLGPDGALAATADGTREWIAPFHVSPVCGLGAGDAFGGALCHGLLSGWDLPRCARAGNAAGAIVTTRLMCADDMPYRNEIDAALENHRIDATAGGRRAEPQ